MGTQRLVGGFSTGAAIAVAVAVIAIIGGFWYLGMMFLAIAAIPMIGALLTWQSFLYAIMEALNRRHRDSTLA